MRKKKIFLSGMTAALLACIVSVFNVQAECKILSSEELNNITIEDLKEEYKLLADEYSALLNSSSGSENDSSYDINQFAPGTPIKDIYSKLGEPRNVEDMDYFKSYTFEYTNGDIPCYGLEDLLFTFFTDENDNVENYTFSGSCDLDKGTQINNDIVNDFSEKYGDGVLTENKFGTSQVEWKLPSSCSYDSVSMSKDSYKKTSITFAFK